MIRRPDLIASGRHSDDFVSLTDLAPTILELAGVSVPKVMTGKSLTPILSSGESGRIDSARTYVLTGKERHVPVQESPDSGGTPMRAIRTHDFLYIYNFERIDGQREPPIMKRPSFPAPGTEMWTTADEVLYGGSQGQGRPASKAV